MADTVVVHHKGAPILALPPSGGDHPSCLVFGMLKGGSSMLNWAVRWLCGIAGLPFVPVIGAFHKAGIPTPQIPPETAAVFRPTGYCYGTFRAFPHEFAIPILDRATQLLMVRDPRDMLTSWYYGSREERVLATGQPAYTHAFAARTREMSVDEFALAHADRYVEAFAAYEAGLNPSRLEVLRYEDVIYDKAGLVDAVCAHFDLAVPPAARAEVVAGIDRRPRAEDPMIHLRQMHPRDHARKLAPATVAQLDERLGPILDRYGYAR